MKTYILDYESGAKLLVMRNRRLRENLKARLCMAAYCYWVLPLIRSKNNPVTWKDIDSLLNQGR